jgi:hypothetical protein
MDFLLSTYQPDGPQPPSDEMGDIVRAVAALEEEMKAAGVWVFNNHLEPPGASTVVRIDAGDTVTSDGPYAEGREHVGGVSIIRVPDREHRVGVGPEDGKGDHPPDRGAAVPDRNRGLRGGPRFPRAP